MTIRKLVLLALLLPLPLAASEGFYAGLKLGSVSVDEDEIDDLKNTPVDIDNGGLAGIIVGYDFGKQVSLEVEASGSEHDLNNVFGYDQLNMGLLGMYASYRSTGQWYFKLRGGLLARTLELERNSSAVPDLDEDNDAFISIGFGGGVRVQNVLLEAEITTIEQGIGSFGFVGIYRFPH